MSDVLIMAGGTGGHIIPALAVARELIDRELEISWIGAHDGLERELISRENITFDGITIKGVRRSGIKRKLMMPFMLLTAIYQSFRIFRKRRPSVVLGMGGFVSGPGGLVATLLGVPLILHEQNTVAGMTNRWLSRVSRANLSGFPRADGMTEFKWIGNPVRKDILELPKPVERLAGRTGALRVLVIGGSQGAKVFNDHLADLLARGSSGRYEVRHQCGKAPVSEIQEKYQRAGVPAEVSPFIEDMADAYDWADVVLCRAGAMTVSEVCAAGAVALFVPYPYAVNDHQTKNANYLVEQDAALMITQHEFIEGRWIAVLDEMESDRMQLTKIATRAQSLAKGDATNKAASICVEVICA